MRGFKLLESGRNLLVSSAGFLLDQRTELTITLIKPDNTTVVVTETGGKVVLGTTSTIDPVYGTLAANTWATYSVEPGVLDQAGDADSPWKGFLTYTNTAAIPDDVFYGECFTFTVEAVCP